MSYDLFLRREAPFTADEFREFFSARRHYHLGDQEAVYENPDTGVYFSFRHVAGGDGDGIDFNMNYLRPHFFGLEAAPVLRRVIEELRFAIDDPQREGMGEGPFSEEGFLRGWNAGNAAGFRAALGPMSGLEPGEILTRPAGELEAIWRWNVARQDLPDGQEGDLFVPLVRWVMSRDGLRSTALWPDGIPELLPAVDVIMLRRERLAPPRALRQREKELFVASREELEARFGPFDRTDRPLRYRRFDHPEDPPAAIRDFFVGLGGPEPTLSRVAMDRVLDAELVAEARMPA